jgi:hypothetical protein
MAENDVEVNSYGNYLRICLGGLRKTTKYVRKLVSEPGLKLDMKQDC